VLHTTPLGMGASAFGGRGGYAKRIFDRFSDKTVLCVGAGKMAILALRVADAEAETALGMQSHVAKAARVATELAESHGWTR